MIRSNRTTVKVTQDEEAPVEKAVLAKAIVDISRTMMKMLDSGLNERAIVCLVAEDSHVGKPDVRAVLHSLKSLTKTYCR